MSKRIKGQDVNLFLNGGVLAASTSCTFQLTANTSDAASKTDLGDGMWDNPEFQNYSWQMSNESFMCENDGLLSLLDTVINGDAKAEVSFQVGASTDTGTICYTGVAIITQLQVQADVSGKVKITLSLEGASNLTQGTAKKIANMKTSPIKGKAMMLAAEGVGGSYHTLAASTSHSLSVSVQTADVSTKDEDDSSINKEVTGKSVTLSTENLVALKTGDTETGIMLAQLADDAMTGRTLKLSFGYYPESVGAASGEDCDWGAANIVAVSGDFMCSSLSVNGANKENATYSAEFLSKGMPMVVME